MGATMAEQNGGNGNGSRLETMMEAKLLRLGGALSALLLIPLLGYFGSHTLERIENKIDEVSKTVARLETSSAVAANDVANLKDWRAAVDLQLARLFGFGVVPLAPDRRDTRQHQ